MVRLKPVQVNSKKRQNPFVGYGSLLKMLSQTAFLILFSSGTVRSEEVISENSNQVIITNEQFFSATNDSEKGEKFDKPFFRIRRLVYPETVKHLVPDGVDSNGLPKFKEVFDSLTKIEIIAMGLFERETQVYRKVYTNEDFLVVGQVNHDGLMNDQVTFSEVNDMLLQGNEQRLVNLLNRESRLGNLKAPFGDQNFEGTKLNISSAETKNGSLYGYTSPSKTMAVYHPTVNSPYLKGPINRNFEIEFFKSTRAKTESIIRINDTFVSVKTKKSAKNKKQFEFALDQVGKTYASGVNIEVIDSKTLKVSIYTMPGESKNYSGNELFIKLDNSNNLEISSAKMDVFANYNPRALVRVETSNFQNDFDLSEKSKTARSQLLLCRKFYRK